MRFEQFEVWAQSGDRWEMVAAFRELQVANAVSAKRRNRVRVVRALYVEDKLTQQELLADVVPAG